MKTKSNQSDKELAGSVERVAYPESGFCVIRVSARSHRDLVTVVGHHNICRRVDHGFRGLGE